MLNLALPPQRQRPDTRLEHQDPVSHTAQRKREKKEKVVGGGGGGVMNWEIGIDIYTLICIKWITKTNLLYKKINKIKFKNSKKRKKIKLLK